MVNRPIQTLSLAPSSSIMDDIIFSQPASQPAQSQAPQSPHKPASSKDVAVPTTPSKSLASRPKNSAIPRSPRPHLPSTPPAPPEDHTFLPATRHALEQALGKASLDRHEVLLQQDKEHTQDYIAQLQDAVKQKNGITPSTHEALLRREVTMWKAKAQEMDESAKTEMQLLRECNGRMEEEMIALRAVAEGLRREGEGLKEEVERLSKENEAFKRENEAFKRENDGLKADMQKGPREEDEERMLLITDLEGDKEEMQRLFDEVMDQNEGLKGEVKNLKDEAKKLKEEVKMLRGVAKEQGGGGGEGKNSKDDKVEKRKIKNIKRRERDRKRRDQVLVKENMQLAAKLAEVEKQKSGTSEEGLEAEDEVWEGFQDSDEGGEMVQEKDDARSAERSKSKKSKKKNKGKKGKKGKKVIKEER